jgi:ribosome-associated toxin RatA of RatAB toxin-antitoxin module
MRRVELVARKPQRSAAEIYPVLCDFEQYPRHAAVVRAVNVTARDETTAESEWEVSFRQGILRWTERDSFDPGALTIHFHQTSGDAAHVFGQWTLHDDDDGCLIRFSAAFEMGIPSLSAIIDPIAEQALRDNICSILQGILGEPMEILPAGDDVPYETRRETA